MIEIPERYLDILRKKGRSLLDIGAYEVALPRRAAKEAVKSIYGTGIAILGGDVYRIVNGRPEPAYDNWYCDQAENESHERYVERSIEATERYISNYPDKEDGSILYSLTLSEGVSLEVARMVQYGILFQDNKEGR